MKNIYAASIKFVDRPHSHTFDDDDDKNEESELSHTSEEEIELSHTIEEEIELSHTSDIM